MFELSVAYKYLIPRWRQLSVSIISLVSMLIIALVVWLIIVFFSVKEGLENSWIEKITALTAPVRVIPTDKYYNSYYYLSDSISAESDYNLKTIGEKLIALHTDPYDALNDEEPPIEWQTPDRDPNGNVKDLVKEAFQAITTLPGIPEIQASDFETTVANLRIRLLRNLQDIDKQTQQFLEYASVVGSFDAHTQSISKALLPPSPTDYNNLLRMQGISADNIKEASPSPIHTHQKKTIDPTFKRFFPNDRNYIFENTRTRLASAS